MNPNTLITADPMESHRPGTPKPFRLLVIEDCEADFDQIVFRLHHEDFILDPPPVRIEMEQELRVLCDTGEIEQFDLIISDYNLADFDALGVLDRLREAGMETPVIVLSGVIGEDRAVQLMRAGASDCMHKDHLSRLAPALRRELREMEVRKQRREAEETARLLELACRMSLHPIAIADARQADMPLVFVNAAFETQTGYAAEEVLGKNARFLHGKDREQDGLNTIRDGLGQGEPCQATLRNYRKNGDLYYNHLAISPLRNEQGVVTHFVAVQSNVTERMENEQRIQRALEREHELNRIKSRFVSMVSHEFRTPLGVINTAAHLLARYLDRMSPEERRDQIEEIRRSVGRMTEMMESCLLHGKIETGRIPCQPHRINLETFGRQLISEILADFDRPGLIELRLDPGLDEVFLDEKILRHILGNLLNNAVKYSSSQGKVLFQARRLAPHDLPPVRGAGQWKDPVCFTIADQGIGIPAPDLPKLFQPFHRAANVGHRPGTGMGLAIVKQCVDLLGGHLEIESQEGKGTAVSVRLPMGESEIAENTTPQPLARSDDL